jgi:hypothetical protein
MSSSSRGPRLRVVAEKKLARPKAPKKKKTAPKKLADWELAECAALDKALRAYNAGRRRVDRLTDKRLATIAAEYGGSKADTQWWSYRNGAKSLPEIDKLIVAWELDRRPQDLFVGWRFSNWTPFAPTRLKRVRDAIDGDDDK